MLLGKGFYIWQIQNSAPDASTLVARAQQAGLSHVIIKIADGDSSYPIDDATNEHLTQASINALKKAGITVAGWTFAYGAKAEPEDQAQIFANRIKQFDLPVAVVNAQHLSGRRWSATSARKFMETLTEALGTGVQIVFSSPPIDVNTDFPHEEFIEKAQAIMPQAYWVARDGGDPKRRLQDVYSLYMQRYPTQNFIAHGSAFYGDQEFQGDEFYWEPTANQITQFINQAGALNLDAVNFWSWQQAWEKRTLWDAVSAYPFKEDLQNTGDALQAPVTDEAAGTPNVAIGLPDTTEDDGEAIIRLDEPGYQEGVYEGTGAELTRFQRNGITFTYVTGERQASTAYAQWLPRISTSGEYLIEAYIPGINATTRRARYHITGVVGEEATTVVELNQYNYSDSYVRLGIFELDGGHQFSGMVGLNNKVSNDQTENPLVAFGPMRWRKVERQGGILPGYADGFDSPVGTPDERATDKIWPGDWYDANPYLSYYPLGYHTGVDLNLPSDKDRGAPCYSIAHGTVLYADAIYNRDGSRHGFGNLVLIRHNYITATGEEMTLYSRYAHVKDMLVTKGQEVLRGDQIATVWNVNTGAHHLHFDIGYTPIFESQPGHWPGNRRQEVIDNYVDPAVFIPENRPIFR